MCDVLKGVVRRDSLRSGAGTRSKKIGGGASISPRPKKARFQRKRLATRREFLRVLRLARSWPRKNKARKSGLCYPSVGRYPG